MATTSKPVLCSGCESVVLEDMGSMCDNEFTTGECMLLCASMGADMPDHECYIQQCVCACPYKPTHEGLQVREPNTAYLYELPDCDICATMGMSTVAGFDGMMQSTGQWAYMCDKHMCERGAGLGLGRGQRLAIRLD